jgi:hypothetical protein
MPSASRQFPDELAFFVSTEMIDSDSETFVSHLKPMIRL